jgi:hypothetical protein
LAASTIGSTKSVLANLVLTVFCANKLVLENKNKPKKKGATLRDMIDYCLTKKISANLIKKN